MNTDRRAAECAAILERIGYTITKRHRAATGTHYLFGRTDQHRVIVRISDHRTRGFRHDPARSVWNILTHRPKTWRAFLAWVQVRYRKRSAAGRPPFRGGAANGDPTDAERGTSGASVGHERSRALSPAAGGGRAAGALVPVLAVVLAGMWVTFFSSSASAMSQKTNNSDQIAANAVQCRDNDQCGGCQNCASILIPDAKAVSPSEVLENITPNRLLIRQQARESLDDAPSRGSMVFMSNHPPGSNGRGRIDSPASGAKLTIVLALEERDAAAALGISPEHLAKLRKAGHVPHTWLGRSVRYPVDALRVWLDQMTTKPTTTEGSEPSPA